MAAMVLVCSAFLGAVAAPGGTAPAGAIPVRPAAISVDGACEGKMLYRHGLARAGAGLPGLREDPALDGIARAWSFDRARTQKLAHNPHLRNQVAAVVPSWLVVGENVGRGPDEAGMHRAFMASPSHRANILSTRYQRIGLGCVRALDGQVRVTAVFAGATASIADRRPSPFRSAGDASGRLRWWLLGVGPTAAQVDADADRILRQGWSAADLTAYLAGSSAHSSLVPGVVRLYEAVFARQPDPAGLQYWVGERQQRGRLDRIATRMAAAPEFRSLYGPLGDADFVTQVYRNVLHREPDAGGRSYWTTQLLRGVSRGSVVTSFSESVENRRATASAVTVSWAFTQIAGRPPSSSERSTWERRLDNGTRQEDLVRFLATSSSLVARAARESY